MWRERKAFDFLWKSMELRKADSHNFFLFVSACGPTCTDKVSIDLSSTIDVVAVKASCKLDGSRRLGNDTTDQQCRLYRVWDIFSTIRVSDCDAVDLHRGTYARLVSTSSAALLFWAFMSRLRAGEILDWSSGQGLYSIGGPMCGTICRTRSHLEPFASNDRAYTRAGVKILIRGQNISLNLIQP